MGSGFWNRKRNANDDTFLIQGYVLLLFQERKVTFGEQWNITFSIATPANWTVTHTIEYLGWQTIGRQIGTNRLIECTLSIQTSQAIFGQCSWAIFQQNSLHLPWNYRSFAFIGQKNHQRIRAKREMSNLKTELVWHRVYFTWQHFPTNNRSAIAGIFHRSLDNASALDCWKRECALDDHPTCLASSSENSLELYQLHHYQLRLTNRKRLTFRFQYFKALHWHDFVWNFDDVVVVQKEFNDRSRPGQLQGDLS